MVDERHRDYLSFLLRIWRVHTNGAWRVSLHSTANDRTYHFDTLDALFTDLLEHLESLDHLDDAAEGDVTPQSADRTA